MVSNALYQGFPALTTAAGENADLEKVKDIHLRHIIPLFAEFPTSERPIELKYCKGDFLSPLFFFFKLREFNLHISLALVVVCYLSQLKGCLWRHFQNHSSLRHIDDVNLHSFWVPASNAEAMLFDRYYCVKPPVKI